MSECRAKNCESIGCFSELLIGCVLSIGIAYGSNKVIEEVGKKIDEAKQELKADIIAVHREIRDAEAEDTGK